MSSPGQLSKLQLSPAVPAGQSMMQLAPASQTKWQLLSLQENSQLLPEPQEQVPLAHCPSHRGLLPSQETWQGPASQTKSQVEPCLHSQLPLAQAPLQAESVSHVTWHGGL